MQRDVIRVGVLVNPMAGVGGEVALKGSDGQKLQQQALARGGKARGAERAARMLQACYAKPRGASAAQLAWYCWGGEMGADAFAQVAALMATDPVHIVGEPNDPSTSTDTRIAARALTAAGIDLLVFVGGDGTARDVLDALSSDALVLGVPAGVKMHSGVFATTPESAAAIVLGLASGEIVSARTAAVVDLDEDSRRRGELNTQIYGEMRIPEAGGFLQHTKEGGRENQALVLEEIAAELRESLTGQVVLGPGSSCYRVKEALGLEPTLLGVDVWQDQDQLGHDVDSQWLMAHAPKPDTLVVSFIRGQGFLFGRGNQQFSAAWLGGIDLTALTIIGSRSKLSGLQGRPLLVDTDDRALNDQLCGLHRVLVGYRDELWYRIATHA